ncbi:MAG TPA: hypothetical protein VFQ24_09955 [Terriglobia bacterium]|nr:hypothetical protein [Terriglobia bacterium]
MLKQFQQDAILLSLAEELLANGSWTGETHLQKATYFLQELARVPLGFTFILYKYGPFSFDLRDELTGMQANLLLSLKPQMPYGPSLVPGELSGTFKSAYEKTISRYRDEVQFIAKWLGGKGVAELERLSTALMVTLADAELCGSDQAGRLRELKPHVSSQDADAAINEVCNMRRNWRAVA